MRQAPMLGQQSGVRTASSIPVQQAWPNVRLESDRLAELGRTSGQQWQGFGLAVHGYNARDELARSIEAMSEKTRSLEAENQRLAEELKELRNRFYTRSVTIDEVRVGDFESNAPTAPSPPRADESNLTHIISFHARPQALLAAMKMNGVTRPPPPGVSERFLQKLRPGTTACLHGRVGPHFDSRQPQPLAPLKTLPFSPRLTGLAVNLAGRAP